jgi:hypothetical protein
MLLLLIFLFFTSVDDDVLPSLRMVPFTADKEVDADEL